MRIRVFGHYWHLGSALVWLADLGAAIAGGRLAFLWLSYTDPRTTGFWLQGTVFGVAVVVAMVAMGLFSRRLRDRMSGIILRITLSVWAGGFAAWLLLSWSANHRMPLRVLAIAMVLAWLLLILARLIARRVIDEDIFKRKVLIYGAGSNAARVLQLRRRADQRGFKVAGFVPARNEIRVVPTDRLLDAGVPLNVLVTQHEIDEIVVAMDDRRAHFPLKDLLECRLSGIVVSELVTFLERETGKVYLDILNPSWMIFGGGFRRDIFRRYSERSFDLLASLGLLIVVLPLMLLTVVAIKVEDGLRAPVFYRQPRVGFAGKVFNILKYRSMRTDAEQDGKARWATADDDRVTRVGKFVRKVRIDELPQLWNVFRGDLSFVGPRPERPEFVTGLAESIPFYSERHAVKPGITGWAQVCYPYGASEQDATEKLQYDLYYVKNHGLMFDLLILLQTVEVIVFGKGAR